MTPVLALVGLTQKWFTFHFVMSVRSWPGQMDTSVAGKMFDGYQEKNFTAEKYHPGIVYVGTIEIQVINADERILLPSVHYVSTASFRQQIAAIDNHSIKLQPSPDLRFNFLPCLNISTQTGKYFPSHSR
jgi:hypothetical protein